MLYCSVLYWTWTLMRGLVSLVTCLFARETRSQYKRFQRTFRGQMSTRNQPWMIVPPNIFSVASHLVHNVDRDTAAYMQRRALLLVRLISRFHHPPVPNDTIIVPCLCAPSPLLPPVPGSLLRDQGDGLGTRESIAKHLDGASGVEPTSRCPHHPVLPGMEEHQSLPP
ncbi:unnamed protein product, partial [Ectocarpus sp. 12 AP-2014]